MPFSCLNPRFDGAFLNSSMKLLKPFLKGLNPRFDGAFLNYHIVLTSGAILRLNPRFDGAFLNFTGVELLDIDTAS